MEQTTTAKRLYKSRRNRIIDGVCGGVAEYFEIDPTIVRILWVLVSLTGTGIFLYIAAMIIMPVNRDYSATQTTEQSSASSTPDKRRFWGVLIMLIGVFILLSNLGLMTEFMWWSFSGKVIFPILLILVGVVLIYTHSRKQPIATTTSEEASMNASVPPRAKELRRSLSDRKLFGVCGGIASYLNVDSTIVRILYIVLVIASFGWGLLLYIIMALLMPEEKLTAL